MLIEGTGEHLDAQRFLDYLRATNRDERGVDTVEAQLLVVLRDHHGGKPAGLHLLAESVGLDDDFVREPLSDLRREGLVASRGMAGHALTAEGRDHLARRGL